jgi:hypothetical protein
MNIKAIMSEHRRCGPVYDGCYAHWSMPHCRADGMVWPCDVDLIRTGHAALAAAAEKFLKVKDDMDVAGDLSYIAFARGVGRYEDAIADLRAATKEAKDVRS